MLIIFHYKSIYDFSHFADVSSATSYNSQLTLFVHAVFLPAVAVQSLKFDTNRWCRPSIVTVTAYHHRLVRSMADLAWSAGVMGAYYESSMAGIVGQIVQWLCCVQFRCVPFYTACYIWWNTSECVQILVQPLGIIPLGFQEDIQDATHTPKWEG